MIAALLLMVLSQEAGSFSGSGSRLAVGLGVFLGHGVIARGHGPGRAETLIARLRPAPLGSANVSFERGILGLSFDLAAPARAIVVENSAGERFPNHATGPVLYGIVLSLAPLHGMTRRWQRGRLRVGAELGGGGALVTADLDNRNGQTAYHAWQWQFGAALRWSVGTSGGFVQLRGVHHQSLATGAVRDLRATRFTLSGGVVLP
jgi:hypothetical protein